MLNAIGIVLLLQCHDVANRILYKTLYAERSTVYTRAIVNTHYLGVPEKLHKSWDMYGFIRFIRQDVD